MRTQCANLLQKFRVQWQKLPIEPSSSSRNLLAAAICAAAVMTYPLAQATEIEVLSISEETESMLDISTPEPLKTAPTPLKATPEPADKTVKNDQAAESKGTANNAAKNNTTAGEVIETSEVEAVQDKAPVKTSADRSPSAVTETSTSESQAAAAETKEKSIPVSGGVELPKAKSVDLAKPISTEELQVPPVKDESPAANDKEKPEPSGQSPKAASSPKTAPAPAAEPESSAAPSSAASDADANAEVEEQEVKNPPAEAQTSGDAPAPAAEVQQSKSLLILGTEVLPSTSTRLAWSPSLSFEGLAMPTPVLVVNGAKTGPTLCLTAAIHGDELNGIEIVRRVLYGLNPKELTGAVIGVPIVNLQGFRRNSRYLADRRDLNRYFPGNPDGSSGARIAHSFFNSVIRHCDVLVDLHTGSFDRINLPQIRADLRDPGSARLTHNFGATVVLHSAGADGTLRQAAADYGIPAVTLEAGGPMRLEEESVSHGVAAIRTLLNSMGMIKKFSFWGKPEPVYYQSSWIRVNHGGILFSSVDLGQKIKAGDVLGTVTDPITNIRHQVVSPHEGRVIGMALNQVMLPGFAAYHIGIAAKDETKAVPKDETLLLNDIDLSVSDEELADRAAKLSVD